MSYLLSQREHFGSLSNVFIGINMSLHKSTNYLLLHDEQYI